MNRRMTHQNVIITMNDIVRLIVIETAVIVIEVIAIVTVTIDRVIEFIKRAFSVNIIHHTMKLTSGLFDI